jgi:glycosyltransferase involved in cell wall biosynthesis
LKELPEEWKLVIVGDGPLRKNYQQKAFDLDLSHRIQFPGILPRAEVLGWYRAADVFVLNSQQENFSFQLLEAMAAGAAIVATSIGALPELVTDGIEGVLCTPNDKSQFRKAIESIQTESELWRVRRTAALQKSKLFSAELSADAFAAALRNIR